MEVLPRGLVGLVTVCRVGKLTGVLTGGEAPSHSFFFSKPRLHRGALEAPIRHLRGTLESPEGQVPFGWGLHSQIASLV